MSVLEMYGSLGLNKEMASNVNLGGSQGGGLTGNALDDVDTQFLLRLFGSHNFLALYNHSQKFGYELQTLSDNELFFFLDKLKIQVNNGSTPPKGDFASRMEGIIRFHNKCQTTLEQFKNAVLQTTPTTSESKPKTDDVKSDADAKEKGESAESCFECRSSEKKEKVVACGLHCGNSFHEGSCKGREYKRSRKPEDSFIACNQCTTLLVLISTLPNLLNFQNKETFATLKPFIDSGKPLTSSGSAPVTNGLQNQTFTDLGNKVMANSMQLGQDSVGINFDQLQQMQILSQQIGSAFPSLLAASRLSLVSPMQGLQKPPGLTPENLLQFYNSPLMNSLADQNKRKFTDNLQMLMPNLGANTIHNATAAAEDGGRKKKQKRTKAQAKANGETWQEGDGSKQRRTRWLRSELQALWQGILLHGNRWYEVQNGLPGRTYYQVKDKGRRLLYTQGWKTGRLKMDNDGAYEDAKAIARVMLADGKGENATSSAKKSEPASTS